MSEKGRGDPVELGDALGAVIADLGIGTKLAESRVLLAWSEVAGPELSRRARPLRMSNGRLELAVPSAVWRTQIAFAKESLAHKLNEHIGEPLVREIKAVNNPLD